MPKEYTQRGFGIYDSLTDNRGSEIRIQHSSAASDDYVWIFCRREELDDSPHLNVEQAKQVIAALQEFVDTYEVKEEEE